VQLSTLTSTFLLEGLKEPENRTIWRSFDERYRPLINSYARRAFGLRIDEAEDSAQLTLTAFADAYRQGKYDRSKGRLSSWLLGIATRQIRNQLRRRARNPEVQVARESNATAFAERITAPISSRPHLHLRAPLSILLPRRRREAELQATTARGHQP